MKLCYVKTEDLLIRKFNELGTIYNHQGMGSSAKNVSYLLAFQSFNNSRNFHGIEISKPKLLISLLHKIQPVRLNYFPNSLLQNE